MKKFFQYRDIQVCYYLKGTGKTIVLIHGFCENSSMWDAFVSSNQMNQIVCIDLPGYGESTTSNECISIVWMAEMVEALLNYEQITSCVIMGHSLGGYVTIQLAERNPGLLCGIGFINSHVYADDDTKKLNRDKSILFIEKNSSRLFIRELINNLFSDDFKKQKPEIAKQLISKAQETVSDKAIIDTLVAMRDRKDKSAVLENIQVPVLFIIGKLDATIPLEISLQQSYLAPVSQVIIRDHVAHMSIFEDTSYTVQVMNEFVDFVNQ
jgi:pimeloyl-ACP methyl ester carboxylesterase